MPQTDARRTTLAAGAGLALVLLSILFLDRPVADWAHGLGKPEWCVWLTWIGDATLPSAVLGLVGAGVAFMRGWRPGPSGRVFLAVCLATLAAVAAKDVLKFVFGRPWPETWIMHNPSWIGTRTYGFSPFHGGPGWASFPSGHTTSITAPCAVLWPHAGRLRPSLGVLPVLVVVGLIGANFHFVSDCLAGALLGIAWGAGVGALICSVRPAA